MKIELGTIDTSQYKTITKSLVGLIPVVAALWDTPAIHNAIKPILDAHPLWDQFIVGIVGMYVLLHNPQKLGDNPKAEVKAEVK